MNIRLALFSVSLALCTALPAFAQESDQTGQSSTTQSSNIELQLAQEIVESGFPPETRMDVFGAVMQQVVSQLNQSMPDMQSDPEVMDIVNRFQQRVLNEGLTVLAEHMQPMMDAMAVGYSEIFTLTELQALHAYITSPEGRGFLARTATVNTHPAYVSASQVYLNEYIALVPSMQQEFRDELAALMQAREEAH